MKARLHEEVRLPELAQGTRVRYTDMGVLSAVAGNKLTHSAADARSNRLQQKNPTGSLTPAVPLAITPTFRPCTHTSDDSYIYQLSLVVATATVSFTLAPLFELSLGILKS